MASRTRLAKVVLAVLAVAFVGLGVLAWEPVYWWATMKCFKLERTQDGHRIRGWFFVQRWGPDEIERQHDLWYVENGRKAREGRRTNVVGGVATFWNVDGSVEKQTEFLPGFGGSNEFFRMTERTAPPWLADVTKQSAPSAPAWILDDKQWQAALDAQE